MLKRLYVGYKNNGISLKHFYNRLGTYVEKPYATGVLAMLFCIEAIFFVPVDPMLIVYCLHKKERALYYALIATLASVAGGVIAYCIGYLLWESVGQRMIFTLFRPEQFQAVLEQYKQYQTWAVLIAGFTPFPYKLITLSAGFCKLPVIPFIACSFIGRGSRFFLLAGIISIWADRVKEFIDRYFNLLVLLFTLLVIIAVWCIL